MFLDGNKPFIGPLFPLMTSSLLSSMLCIISLIFDGSLAWATMLAMSLNILILLVFVRVLPSSIVKVMCLERPLCVCTIQR